MQVFLIMPRPALSLAADLQTDWKRKGVRNFEGVTPVTVLRAER
jgi:hypothetical protein